MKVTLLAFGSRGDVQPMIALGHGLQAAGYDVHVAASEDFAPWVTREGFGFEPFPMNMREIANTDAGKRWMAESSENPIKGIRLMREMFTPYAPLIGDYMHEVASNTNVLVSGMMTMALSESIKDRYNVKHVHTLLQPMTPSRMAASNILPYWPWGRSPLNRLAGFVTQTLSWNIFSELVNDIRTKNFDMPPLTRMNFVKMWNRVPILYGISPIMSPDDDYPAHRIMTGYWFYDAPPDWQPSQALCEFLEAGVPPVYIGFGSMSAKDPAKTTDIMVDALQRSGQRGVIYSGWAGLTNDDLPDDIFLLDDAPHDWLFPRMKAVVHHGGAGTTAAALRAGIPQTIVAHIADQNYFGRRVYELGVGSKPISRAKLSTDKLARRITEITNNADITAQAKSIGQRIQQEDGVRNAVAAFEEMVQR